MQNQINNNYQNLLTKADGIIHALHLGSLAPKKPHLTRSFPPLIFTSHLTRGPIYPNQQNYSLFTTHPRRLFYKQDIIYVWHPFDASIK